MLGKSQAKYIQSLGQKKVRDEAGLFLAEGPKIVSELLHMGAEEIVQLFAVKDWILQNEKDFAGIDVVEVDEVELGRISQMTTPNKVLATVRKPTSENDLSAKAMVSIVLDTIQDPGNLGTIIRIADWFNISQLICSKDCADVYNPKVVQSTMGSIMRVQTLYTDLPAWLEEQKDVYIYAAALEGQNVATMKPLTEGILVIGNESKGISPDIMKLVDVKITIPRKGNAESLNAAVATGIILSHIL
ncbi:MAG: RNA methyltransferase [Chitinophagaceae bacterium]|nr:MAG: RNA methyltransferase [Chitinophagaceae bacterium]